MSYRVKIETPEGKKKYKAKSLRAIILKLEKIDWMWQFTYDQAFRALKKTDDWVLIGFKKWTTIKIKQY